MNDKTTAELIFRAGVDSVLPDKLICSQIKYEHNILNIAGIEFDLKRFERVFVVGAGKATALMAHGLEVLLGSRITSGHIVVKYGHGCPLKSIKISEAGHPLPDENGLIGTNSILALVNEATENDLVICLISGGASALLVDLTENISLSDLVLTNQILLESGANIVEMNTVRKHLSKVKGGQLTKAIYPATTLGLILSDVIGNPIDIIASGPTTIDSSTFYDAMNIIDKYELNELLPDTIISYIRSGISGSIAETPKPDDCVFSKVQNFVIGSNQIALQAACEKSTELGFLSYVITDRLEGDFKLAANKVLNTIEQYKAKYPRENICMLFGGEPTVKVTGTGLGGRNQHLALYLSTRIGCSDRVTILCAGTDGTDGPTDVAGAVVDCNTCIDVLHKFSAVDYLSQFDSYHFFQLVGDHVITGATFTNVMDIIVVLIRA